MFTPRNAHVLAYYKAKTMLHCERRSHYDKLGYSTLTEGAEALATRYAEAWRLEIEYTSFIPGIIPAEDGCTLIIA